MKANSKKGRNERCTTGIEGLDDILGGGLPRNRLYLVQGDPGAGKTTLALQFLLEGVKQGETGLYITLSETREELEVVADSHGWSLDKLNLFELSTIEAQVNRETESTFFHPSEVELNRTVTAMLEEAKRVKPMRLVLDSLSELRLLAETSLRYRRQILQLKQYFAGLNCTVLLLDDCSGGSRDLQVESTAHGVISLHRVSPDYGISRRNLNVVKLRGVKFREGNHDFIIQRGGLEIFPRLIAAEHHVPFKRDSFPSGISELDELLGGGLDRGTSTMFMGPPGTGKSTIAMKFALSAAKKKEKSIVFLFDETTGTLMNRARKLNMDIEPHVKNGTIHLEQVDPAELSPGELTSRIRRAVIGNKTRIVIIDSINGYLNAMPAENYLNLQLHELLSYLNQMGVITIMVLAQQGLVGAMQTTVDLTYLSDTVILLRYFEAKGTVKQALSVIKKRSGNHERSIRELAIDKSGISLSEPLVSMQGILTGTPVFHEAKGAPVLKPK